MRTNEKRYNKKGKKKATVYKKKPTCQCETAVGLWKKVCFQVSPKRKKKKKENCDNKWIFKIGKGKWRRDEQ